MNNQPHKNSQLFDMVNPVKDFPLGNGVIKCQSISLQDIVELSEIYPDIDPLRLGQFISENSNNTVEQLKLFATFVWFGTRHLEPDLKELKDCMRLINIDILLNKDKMNQLIDIISHITTIELTRHSDVDEPPPEPEDSQQENTTEKKE